jgi:hypothetical protein
MWCLSRWPRVSKARICGRSLAGVVGSDSVGNMVSVSCDCCVFLSRGLCDDLNPRPEESYQLLFVSVCGLDTSRMRRSWQALGHSATGRKYRGCQKMYTHFKKGKNCIKIVMILRFSKDNRAYAIFFDCPACRMVMLAFIWLKPS